MIRKLAISGTLTLLVGGAALAQTVSSMTDATLPLTNQEYLYIVQNGAPRRVHPGAIVPTGITIPNADLLGGLNNAFTSVTVGSNLNLSGGVLSMPVPTADLLGGSANAFSQITVGSELTAGSTLNLTTTGVVAGSYTNVSLTVDAFGRLTAASSGSSACSGVAATAVLFSNGTTCVGEVPNFVYSTTHGQVQIINKETTSVNSQDPAALIVESPNVQIAGAIQFGVSNLSGAGAWGMVGFQDAGDARDGPYTYFRTSDASPILLGSMAGAFGAPRVGVNYTGCMVADIACGHGDLQIYGHRTDHEGGSNYWVLALGDGAALIGGLKADTAGYGVFQLGRSETSTFVPHVHIAENGPSFFNGFGTTPYLGVGTNAPGTMLDVNGDITNRAVLSCNTSNAAVQTDGTGKLVCGSISGGGGGVTATGTLTANAIVIGAGGSAISPLGSLGTTTTLLHGDAAGAPTFGAVALASDVSGTLAGANGGSGIANTGKTLTLGATATSLPSAPASTQCLHMDASGNVTATGADCTGGGGTSGVSLISTQTANNTATSLAWTGLTGSRYLLVIENLLPSTNNTGFLVQFGEGGTPTWMTGGTDYAWYYNYYGIDVVDSGIARTTGTGWPALALLDNSEGLIQGNITFNGLSAASRHSILFNYQNKSAFNNKLYWQQGSGSFTVDTNAITAIRIISDSAVNILSGRASLYLLN